jgi:hypothetical protein
MRIGINSTDQSLYVSKKVKFPKPELYVIYSGDDKKNVPKTISLADSYLEGDNSVLDLKIKVCFRHVTILLCQKKNKDNIDFFSWSIFNINHMIYTEY